MDLNRAIQFGLLVNAAYAINPNDLTNAAGKTIDISYGSSSTAYDVVTSVYASDLATDMNPGRGQNRVSIGLAVQSESGDLVVALRGTEGILEWIHDAQFLPVRCPFSAAAGNTEDGFTAMYGSLTTSVDAGALTLLAALSKMKKNGNSLTICGHSLGGALSTLLALDIAINTELGPTTVYTYASPRVGDSTFVSIYNHVLPNTFRIANRADLVPKLPLPPLYDHVAGLFEVNSVELGIPPKLLVKPEIPCEHYLSSYLYLLSRVSGGQLLSLDAKCAP